MGFVMTQADRVVARARLNTSACITAAGLLAGWVGFRALADPEFDMNGAHGPLDFSGFVSLIFRGPPSHS